MFLFIQRMGIFLSPSGEEPKRMPRRLAATAPKGFEREKAFRRRVRNAVYWVNRNHQKTLRNAVASMTRRLEVVTSGKGAMTPY